MSSNGVQAIAFLTLATLASLSFALCNRYSYEYYGIHSNTFMNGLYFFIIAIAGKVTEYICRVLPKRVLTNSIRLGNMDTCSPLLGILLGLSVVADGLSFKMNFVGLYQYSLLYIIPCVWILSYFYKMEGISINIINLIASVLATLLGIAYTIIPPSKGEDTLTNYGFICCLFHVLTTAFHQIYLKKTYNELNLSPLKLFINQAPIASIIILICSPMIDGVEFIQKDLFYIQNNRIDCLVSFKPT